MGMWMEKSQERDEETLAQLSLGGLPGALELKCKSWI